MTAIRLQHTTPYNTTSFVDLDPRKEEKKKTKNVEWEKIERNL